MKNQKISKLFILLMLLFFSCPIFAMAADAVPTLEINPYPALPPFATNPPTSPIGHVLPGYIAYVFGFIIVVSAIASVIMIAVGGVQYIYSSGSPAITSEAISKITSSVLGLIILGCSYLILITINPVLVQINEPYVAPFASGIQYGVWACQDRINFRFLWTEGKAIQEALKVNPTPDDSFKARIKAFNQAKAVMESNCYLVGTAGPVPINFANKISSIYLVPEENKRAFGAIIYDELVAKSKARVVFHINDGIPILNDIYEIYKPDKKVAYLRPFVLIHPSPSNWHATLYQMPHLNINAPDAKWTTCYTAGVAVRWCDLSALAIAGPSLFPSPAPSPVPPSGFLKHNTTLANISDNSDGCPVGQCSGNFGGGPPCSPSSCTTGGGGGGGGGGSGGCDPSIFCLNPDAPYLDPNTCTCIAGDDDDGDNGDDDGDNGDDDGGGDDSGCGDPTDPSDCGDGTDDGGTSPGSSTKPPKVTSVEFKGTQFIVFFKENVSTWNFDSILDVVGPGTENNLSSGNYIMGNWNDECKETRAEEPNSETFYSCAKKAALINAEFF